MIAAIAFEGLTVKCPNCDCYIVSGGLTIHCDFQCSI